MVFHKHQLVFIAIPKTASTSIWWLLRNRTDGFDTHWHYTYLDLYKTHDKDVVDSYYSFSVVRNPYTRFISAYKQFSCEGEKYHGLSPYEVLKKLQIAFQLVHTDSQEWTTAVEMNFIPQYVFTHIRGIQVVDKLLRYESLSDEWESFTTFQNERVKISNLSSELPRHNEPVNKSQIILTDEEKKMIQKLYKKDFELFSYIM